MLWTHQPARSRTHSHPSAPLALVIALLAIGLPGCSTNRGDTAMQREGTASIQADTMRGTVSIVGADPATWVVLRPSGGGADITLNGDPVRDLRALAGVEVEVRGRLEGTADGRAGSQQFEVERFLVRAVDGTTARDGILEIEDGTTYLVSRDGERTRIAHLPTALRNRAGAWIWLAGPLDGDIVAFGVIREAGQLER